MDSIYTDLLNTFDGKKDTAPVKKAEAKIANAVDTKEQGAAQIQAKGVINQAVKNDENSYLAVDFLDEDDISAKTDTKIKAERLILEKPEDKEQVEEEDPIEEDEDDENPLDDEDFEMGIDDFEDALSQNEDVKKIIEMIGKDDFFGAIDADGDGNITDEELQSFGFDIKNLDNNSLEDLIKHAEDAGLSVPTPEELEGMDLSKQVFTKEVIEKIKEAKKAAQQAPVDEGDNSPVSGGNGVYSGGGVSGGGYTGGVSGGTPITNTNINTPSTSGGNTSLEDLTGKERPEKEQALNDAKNNLNNVINDGGELASYKNNMENAHDGYVGAMDKYDSDLAQAIKAKHDEVIAMEKSIVQKQADIANQECLISSLETELSNLLDTKANLMKNKKELEELDLSEVKPEKRAALRQSIKELEEKIEETDAKIKEVKEKLEKAKSDLKDMKTGKEDSLDALQKQRNKLYSDEDGQLGSLQYQADHLIETHPEIKALLDDYNAKKDAYDTKKSEMTDKAISDLKAAQSSLNETDVKITEAQMADIDKKYSAKKFTQTDLFDPDMKITITKVNDGNTMPYLLIAPENADPNEPLPVLFYLHGMGQVGKSLDSLEQHEYDPAVIMQNWDLNNFNGYIICPLLGSGNWCNKNTENQIRQLYDNFSSTHAVDEDRVAVAGASLGAMGALYMANAMPDVFCKAASFSPYNPGNLGSGMKIPTKAFVGSNDDPNSKNFAKGTLKNYIGEENLYILNGQTHNSLPGAALCMDLDGNGCSDILEWLFSVD